MAEQSNPEIQFEGKKIGEMSGKKDIQVNRGAWTTEEDTKLAEVIAIHGAKKWKTITTLAGLNRCGKSCRLRWLNYLRPNIKRGNFSDQEDDLILRLHKLLGNRWSLIAGRLPDRTDNEIKNYWNSHLSKKISHNDDKQDGIIGIGISVSSAQRKSKTSRPKKFRDIAEVMKEERRDGIKDISTSSLEDSLENSRDFDVNDFFNFSDEGPVNMEWMSNFIEF